MNGLIALLGSGEYLPVMDSVDRYLLDSLGTNGHAPRVVCLATAAGQEGDVSIGRWSHMGLEHFQNLGADVSAPPIIDRASADDPQWEERLASADLIYFSGGNPLYLYETMQGSRAWKAAQQAWERGAIYAGCSAGAMILAEQVPDIRTAGLRQVDAFNIMPAKAIIPHFDRMRSWAPLFMKLLGSRLGPDDFALGIDENTALVGHLGGEWQVMGQQTVSYITQKDSWRYSAGDKLTLPIQTV
jgi:cyanophycinase